MSPTRQVCILLVLAAVVVTPGIARAQDTAIRGLVTDTTGLMLPGVTVEARNATVGGQMQTTVTDSAGRLTISALQPGTYDVTFTLPGFAPVVRDSVEIGAGATVPLDIEMAVQLEERVVVVGSRAQPRSVTESTVPIDAIPSEDVANQGNTDVGDQLRTLVPSYNVNPQPVGDAARLIRPATLRGLAPDHTLVLVNGKRRHRGAVIAWIGNGVATTYTDRATAFGRAEVRSTIRLPRAGVPGAPTPDHETRLARRSLADRLPPRLGRPSFLRRFFRDRRKRPTYNEKTAVSPGAIPECEHRQDWVAEGAVSSEPVSPRIWASARRVLNPRLCPRAH